MCILDQSRAGYCVFRIGDSSHLCPRCTRSLMAGTLTSWSVSRSALSIVRIWRSRWCVRRRSERASLPRPLRSLPTLHREEFVQLPSRSRQREWLYPLYKRLVITWARLFSCEFIMQALIPVPSVLFRGGPQVRGYSRYGPRNELDRTSGYSRR